jgi:hypothetical protein
MVDRTAAYKIKTEVPFVGIALRPCLYGIVVLQIAPGKAAVLIQAAPTCRICLFLELRSFRGFRIRGRVALSLFHG